MPGLYAFNRRWIFGSDDLVISAIFLLIIHVITITILATEVGVETFNADRIDGGSDLCDVTLRDCLIGFLSTLCVAVVLEATASVVSVRGTILDDEPRRSMEYILYVRLGVQVVEVVWQVLGVIWLVHHYDTCDLVLVKRTILGVVIVQWILTASIVVTVWLTFDEFGSSRTVLTGSESDQDAVRRRQCARLKYEKSWGRSFRRTFCCVDGERNAASFDEIARLFTMFFVEQNIVASDIVAGLVLVRRYQRLMRSSVLGRRIGDTGDPTAYDIFSGVPITSQTKFLDEGDVDPSVVEGVVNDFAKLVHYMRYALAAYGWPMYLLAKSWTGPCKLLSQLRCCGNGCSGFDEGSTNSTVVEGDNYCRSNYVALRQLAAMDELDVVYVTYRTNISQPSFYIAVDYREQAVVISIRGTLSLPDILTDLMADAEDMPISGTSEVTWRAHKGILKAAEQTLDRIKTDNLLEAAFQRNPDRGTRSYKIIVVGHSLGAGTAAILAILLKQDVHFRDRVIHCYSFSPPGGLLSSECVRDTKSFITTVILGKDIVPRIGLNQLNEFKYLMIDLVQRCPHPKWKVIGGGTACCSRRCLEDDEDQCETVIDTSESVGIGETESRDFVGRRDLATSRTVHRPLYPPGHIIHIVYKSTPSSHCCGRQEQTIRAISADNENDFNEVIISSKMVRDHRPENVLAALVRIHTRKKCGESAVHEDL